MESVRMNFANANPVSLKESIDYSSKRVSYLEPGKHSNSLFSAILAQQFEMDEAPSVGAGVGLGGFSQRSPEVFDATVASLLQNGSKM